MRGEPDRLIARTGEGLARAIENGFAIYENAVVPNTRIPSWIQLGELERCLAEGPAGVAALAGSGSTLIVPHFKSGLALAMHLAGCHDEARVMIDDAVKMAEATGQSTYLPEIYRIKGEILLGSSDGTEDPEIYFQKAIESARSHNARSWELRTSTSLARLWQQQGKKKEAHDLLAPVYDWFTEGFDTKDLQEAKALLGELQSSQ
jgi:predicted ATPase